MGLQTIALQLIAVVTVLVGIAAVAVIGPARIRATASTVGPRLVTAAPSVVGLGLVLVLNGLVRDAGVDLSWLIGVNVTDSIYGLEGTFVAQLQSLSSPALTSYFASVYVYGYAFLLVFPLVAYLAIDDPAPLRTTATAYAVNYGVGLACYVLFIAYGPRNLMPDLVDPLLYRNWPEAQLLTSQVNRNTNVFPSLHASLSATAAIISFRTRDVYPRWFPIAAVLAVSVAISTMYLGIHWGTDVLAGVLLAVLSVTVADRLRTRTVDPARERPQNV